MEVVVQQSLSYSPVVEVGAEEVPQTLRNLQVLPAVSKLYNRSVAVCS